jgi:hypothetical protein
LGNASGFSLSSELEVGLRERVDTLPFVVEGLWTVEYEEIYAI